VFTFTTLTRSAPAESNDQVKVIRYENKPWRNNKYHFVYELSDGQVREENGSLKTVDDISVVVVKGHYVFVINGKEYRVDYAADENGYHNLPPTKAAKPTDDYDDYDDDDDQLGQRINDNLIRSLLGG